MSENTTSWSHGVFYWNELMSWDVEKDKAFYAKTLGWTFEGMPMDEGTYWLARLGDKTVCGIFPMTKADFDGVPAHWFSYISVDDVDARFAKASTLGAKLLRPIMDIPGVGRIATIQEPGGAMIGWMTPPKG